MGLSAAAQVLRSFQWAKDSELRIKWTAGLTGSADRRLGSVRKAMQPIDDGNEKIAEAPAHQETMGDIASSGRVCHCSTSANTSSVRVEMRSGETSSPYNSSKCPRISRTLISRASMRIT